MHAEHELGTYHAQKAAENSNKQRVDVSHVCETTRVTRIAQNKIPVSSISERVLVLARDVDCASCGRNKIGRKKPKHGKRKVEVNRHKPRWRPHFTINAP